MLHTPIELELRVFFFQIPLSSVKVAPTEQPHSLLVPTGASSIFPEIKPRLERGMVV